MSYGWAIWALVLSMDFISSSQSIRWEFLVLDLFNTEIIRRVDKRSDFISRTFDSFVRFLGPAFLSHEFSMVKLIVSPPR